MRLNKTYKWLGLAVSCWLLLFVVLPSKQFLSRNVTFASTGSYFNSRKVLEIPQESNWRSKAMMFKVKETAERFMTIGIPTVQRQHSNYFMETLDSLLNCTSQQNIREIFVVIFLADFNQTWRYEMFNKIVRRYTNLVHDGTIQVIEAPRAFYPPLDNLLHTYNDSASKRKWRSKQNIDYSFLWLYSQNLSKFYMQMEDDIFTIPGYIDIIKHFIAEQKSDWTCLEFSELGFIGKVYHSKYLERLAKVVLLFYEEQPVDYIFLYFNILNLQHRRIIRRPTIFQHVGFYSSLAGKIQPLKDNYFDVIKKTLNGDNPPAKLFTTLKTSPDFPLEISYSHEDGYFWSHSPPSAHDTIHILFNEPQFLEKVIILSGSEQHPTDKFEDAQLSACLSVRILDKNNIECFNVVKLGNSINGKIVAENLQTKTNMNNFKVTCLKVSFSKSQQWWLIVREIAVFVRRT